MALLQRRFFLGILILITLLHVAQSVSVFREPFRWIKKRLFKLKDPIDDPAYTVWAKGLGRWTRKAEHGKLTLLGIDLESSITDVFDRCSDIGLIEGSRLLDLQTYRGARERTLCHQLGWGFRLVW